MNFFRRVVMLTMAALPALTAPISLAEDRPSSKLAFTRAANELHFDTGVLSGTLGAGGKSLGLRPLTHRASGVQVAGAFGILSPYRMLTSDARFGTAAWDWASRSDVLADGAASVHWSPDKDHPLDMTGIYRWSTDDTLDLDLAVKPQRDLRRFELFLASYFHGFPASLACVQQPASAGGFPRFVEALQAGGDWQAFPRDDAAASIFADGRWSRPPNPVAWKIMPRLAAPLALRRDAESGLTAVLMSRPHDCFAVSMPYGKEAHRSVYLSLFGGDLKAGHAVSARARLIIGKDITEDRALELYRAYLDEKHEDAAVPASSLVTPPAKFYAYCVEVGVPGVEPRPLAEQAKLLRELGYDGTGLGLDATLESSLKLLDDAGLQLYLLWANVNVAPGKGAAISPALSNAVGKLKGRPTTVCVLLGGLKPGDRKGIEPAVKALRELGDLAAEAGVKISIYNHADTWTESLPLVIEVVRKTNHPQVGFNFNLCHWLKVEGGKDYRPLLRENADKLFVVTINGATIGAKPWTNGLIRPLDEGDFDQRQLLRTLREIDYRGPVGLMCYGVPGDARQHLARSMKAWRGFQQAGTPK